MQKSHLHLKDHLGKPFHFAVVFSLLPYFFLSGLWAATSLIAHVCRPKPVWEVAERVREAKPRVSPKVMSADWKTVFSSEKREPMVHPDLRECGSAGGEGDGTTGKAPLVASLGDREHLGLERNPQCSKGGLPIPPPPKKNTNFKNTLLGITEGIPSACGAAVARWLGNTP